MLRKLFVGLSAAVVVVACGSETPPSTFGTSGGEGDAGFGGGQFGGDAGPEPTPVECKKMDIVFVIDNSQSMVEEQKNLAKNIPEFIKIINEYKTAAGELLEYRVGIVSSDDEHDKGALRKSRGLDTDPEVVGCDPGADGRPWLERTDPEIAASFGCRARLGVLGSNVERPLEAAKLSVVDRIADGTNKDGSEPFVRKDALLAFVVISDEDEGGGDHDQANPPKPLKDVASYAGDFDNVKEGFRGRWATAVIAGDKVCTSGLGQADEAVRLKRFTSVAAKNGVFSSICEGDLTTGLKAALDTFSAACKGFPGVK